ncbi:hypothetical protein MMC31_002142 [Peltigera leucophlebia]|nr:hypothetical protein [Peltigera leucophlebia]
MLPVPFACNASNIFLLLLFLAWTLEVTGDADFDSVKVKMTKNTSGRWDSRIKYWPNESQFTDGIVPLDDERYWGGDLDNAWNADGLVVESQGRQ